MQSRPRTLPLTKMNLRTSRATLLVMCQFGGKCSAVFADYCGLPMSNSCASGIFSLLIEQVVALLHAPWGTVFASIGRILSPTVFAELLTWLTGHLAPQVHQGRHARRQTRAVPCPGRSKCWHGR